MAWFIIQSERKTWTKYLVEAEDEEAAFDSDHWQYLGYVDGDDTEAIIVGDPMRARRKPWQISSAMLRASHMLEGCCPRRVD